jgi:hypothetical protein
MANDFYVSSFKEGADSNDGSSKSTPVRNLATALGLVKGSGTVYMTGGKFDGPEIKLLAGVTLSGNWDESFDKQEAFTTRLLSALKPDADLCGKYTCISASGADRVVSIAAPGATLTQLVVVGPDRSKTNGSNSFGVVVDGVDANINQVVVKGGVGGVGNTGDGGGVGSGYCSNGGDGGWMENIQQGGVSDFCTGHKGGQGQTVSLNGRVANGGQGGDPGNSNCSKWPSVSYVGNGGSGSKGDPGIEGIPGIAAPAADAGAFARLNGALNWASGNVGGRGGSGSAGGGGGGGGPGGSWNVIYWCLVGYPVMGGRGHVGNRGGCGGEGGGGGYSGGGSFALVVNGGKVHATDLVLFGGQGGTGGRGGDGNVGAVGEIDDSVGAPGGKTTGCSSSVSQAGTGGSGGHGGKGGGGGGGSGGNGGPAIALAKLKGGDVLLPNGGGLLRISGGKVGSGGTGGHGADSATVAPTGGEGVHADSKDLELK